MLKAKEIFKITWIPVLVASLCCMAPAILVTFGLSTVAFAASLADTLYGDYKWVFRGVGLILLTISIIFYLRRQRGICTIDDVKKRRNEVINIAALSLIVFIGGYIIWLYGVVEIWGILLGIWG